MYTNKDKENGPGQPLYILSIHLPSKQLMCLHYIHHYSSGCHAAKVILPCYATSTFRYGIITVRA